MFIGIHKGKIIVIATPEDNTLAFWETVKKQKSAHSRVRWEDEYQFLIC